MRKHSDRFLAKQAERRRRVAELSLRGLSSWAIADELEIDQKTVTRDQLALQAEGMQFPDIIIGRDGKPYRRP